VFDRSLPLIVNQPVVGLIQVEGAFCKTADFDDSPFNARIVRSPSVFLLNAFAARLYVFSTGGTKVSVLAKTE
jgi:hypothetical protein